MQVTWRAYRFDYDRFVEIRPILRRAAQAADFETLATTPELEALVLRIAEGKVSPAGALQPFVIALCCRGQAVDLDKSFLNSISSLVAARDTEQVGEALRSIVRGSANVEQWLAGTGDGPLRGFLTAEQTIEVNDLFKPLMPILRRNRRGVLARLQHIVRLLANHTFDQSAALRCIAELTETASDLGEGLAIVSV